MRRSLVALAASSFIVLPSCSDPDPASRRTLSERFTELGAGVRTAAASLKSSATASETITPAELGKVTRLPASATGGVDIQAEQAGKRGAKATEIAGASGEETVTIFVPDPPATGTGTSVTSPSFLAWQSSDDGLCYLAWTRGASWFVVSECGGGSGAWVCSAASGAASCEACSAAGDCAPCDVDQPTFTCAW